MSYETRLDQQTLSASFTLANASASFAQSGNSRGGNLQYNQGRKGRGRGTFCQLCGRTGHYAAICFHRFYQSFQGHRPNQVSQGGGYQNQNRGNLNGFQGNV
ncbi:hypothetical protein ACOSQ3_021805 [Xanthoceras sorbifolium]